MGHNVLADVDLTWRVSPYISEEKASRTTVSVRVSITWCVAIVGKLLKESEEQGKW